MMSYVLRTTALSTCTLVFISVILCWTLFFEIFCVELLMFGFHQARPFLEEYAIDDLIDPRLGGRYSENEVYCMLHAANLCIRRDPHSRPRMSHVSGFHLQLLSLFIATDETSLCTLTSSNVLWKRFFEYLRVTWSLILVLLRRVVILQAGAGECWMNNSITRSTIVRVNKIRKEQSKGNAPTMLWEPLGTETGRACPTDISAIAVKSRCSILYYSLALPTFFFFSLVFTS